MTAGPTPRTRVWNWWIRLWLRAYPRRFRESLGSDLTRQDAAAPREAAFAFVTAGFSAARDLLGGGLGARADDAATRLRGVASVPPGRGLGHDVRLGIRLLRRRPGHAAALLLTIALASGLATAVFAVYDATLVRALPYPAADRVVSIGSMWLGSRHSSVSIPEYLDYRRRARTLAEVAAYRTRDLNFTDGPDGPERVKGAQVTASFFDVLRVTPVHGRLFRLDEDQPGAPPVTVISEGLWRRRFGADPAVVGRALRMNDQLVTVVGIVPSTLQFPERGTVAWLPLGVNPANPGNRGAHNRLAIARLHDAATIDAARAEMSGIAADLAREYPDNYPDGSGWGISVLSLRDLLVGDVRAPLNLLLVAVGFVLVIATANVAGLYVVRATERRPELLIRAALGASAWRLGRQAVIEGALAGLAGAAVAVPLAALGVDRTDALLPASVVRPASIVLDVRILAFAIAGGSLVSCGAALIAALVGRPGRGGSPVEAGLRTTAGRSL
jgi:predicted permease